MCSEGATRQKLPSMSVLQDCHCVLVPQHDSCDEHLDVSRCATGLGGRISQITDEPRLEGSGRQDILGLVVKISEPVFGHAWPDDLPLEAFIVNLEKVETIANITEVGPKRVPVPEQDAFNLGAYGKRARRTRCSFFILAATVSNEPVAAGLRHCNGSRGESLRSCAQRQNSE